MADGNLVLSESASILRYLNTQYGDGTLTPSATPDYFRDDEWLDFVESSAAMPSRSACWGNSSGAWMNGWRRSSDLKSQKTLDHISAGVGDRPFLMGDRLMLADIQMSYLLSLLEVIGELEHRPVLAAYYDRLQAQPGFHQAVTKGGPIRSSQF